MEPEICVLSNERVPKMVKDKVLLITKTTTMIHLSMKNSFKKILEMDGMFQSTLSYMDLLYSEPKIKTNFIQGTLWKKQLEKFDKGKIVLPLHIYFDDLEPGNALGSHAGKNQIGCVYYTIPCLPPNFSSKLDSILVSDIFYSQDRKKIGNKLIFQKLISELLELYTFGLEIIVGGENIEFSLRQV